MMTVTTRGIAWLILKEVMRLQGISESIVSDQDPKFTSIFWKELHRLMGSKLLMFTAFHPQMYGATEWTNRSIAQILCTVVSNDQKDWSGKCLIVEFAINSSINATRGYAPFEHNHGYMPRSGQQISTDTTFVRGQPLGSPFSLHSFYSPLSLPPIFLSHVCFTSISHSLLSLWSLSH